MNSVFVTGIAASGKSFVAKKISKNTGVIHVKADSFRKEMRKDPQLKKWINFYWKLDEEKYYKETDCQTQWDDFVKLSEMCWGYVSNKIKLLLKKSPIIVEGAHLLPHLMAKDFKIGGVVLLGESEEVILERLKKAHRWGKTDKLKKKEADAYFNCMAKWYEKEAKKHGYKTFKGAMGAEKELLRMIYAQ